MLKDGEKYACAACIRGHRVSSCQHADRDLHHINKKGRPVSQCQHCRGLRKSRAAHVKCDCGEHHHHDGNGVTTEHKDELCPCTIGARCTCAFKKDLSDLDENYKIHKPVHHKPAFPNRKSDGTVPRARNGGHHPPLHRQNNSAHQFGIPYTIRRLHSDEMTNQIPVTSDYNPNLNSETLLMPNQPPTLIFAPNSPHDTRLTRSAHTSPILGPVPDVSDDPLSREFSTEFQASVPFSFFNNGNPFANNSQRHSIHDFSNFNLDDLDYGNFESQAPLSANDELGVDWSQFEIDQQAFDESNLNFYPQPPSNASMDYSASGRPDLSHSSSRTASDQGEPRRFADFTAPTSNININPRNAAQRSFAFESQRGIPTTNSNPFGLSQSLPHGLPAAGLSAFNYEDQNIPNMDLFSGPVGSFDPTPKASVPLKVEPFDTDLATRERFPSLAMPSTDEDDEDGTAWPQEPTFDAVFPDGMPESDTQPQEGVYVDDAGIGGAGWV